MREGSTEQNPHLRAKADATGHEQIDTPSSAGSSDLPGDHSGAWFRHLERVESILLLGGVASLVFSFVALGVLPAIELRDEARAQTPANYQALTPTEQLGFAVYKREGCAYCHSTFVRDTEADKARFGPAAEAWEYQDTYPQQWGTRRIGPDLSREAGLRSDDWHEAHLFNPRSTVPQSIMPSYPWLFTEKGTTVVPTAEGAALVAYLQSLGRNIKESGPQVPDGAGHSRSETPPAPAPPADHNGHG